MAAVAGVLGMGGTGYAADILAGGSMFGGPSQAIAVCYVFNAGNSPVRMSVPQILNEFGEAQKLDINGCSSSLGGGLTCGVASQHIANNETFSCVVSIGPSKANVRGVLELRDANENVLQNTQLR